ncbi:tachylectin-related carbohydrate-binding protein, partial [Streptomyces sp. TRM76130]|nr:tachylectin-related carbohydrate-binding protein [Streptomyces sp. TRM76130]
MATAALPFASTSTERAYAADDVTCTTTGALYSTVGASLLRRNLPDPAGGTGALPEASTIDTGWDKYPRVLAGTNATFYGFASDGLYLSHRDATTATWDVHHRKISDAYASYRLDANRNKIT